MHQPNQAVRPDLWFTQRAARGREGFSLLLFGFGSKRSLLERFAVEALLDGGVLSVNGLCRGLSVRALLLRVASAMRLPRCLGPLSSPQQGAARSARARCRSVCRAAPAPRTPCLSPGARLRQERQQPGHPARRARAAARAGDVHHHPQH